MTNTQANGTPSKSYSVLHLFCGLGGGALGFSAASARLGLENARFETLGAVDFDPDACKAYEALTGDKATCADIAKMTPQELFSVCKGRCPDVVFSSPPCKGHSGLLSNDKASSPKYQAMNKLPLMAIELVLAVFATRPRFILIENVLHIPCPSRARWISFVSARLTPALSCRPTLQSVGQHRAAPAGQSAAVCSTARAVNRCYQPKSSRKVVRSGSLQALDHGLQISGRLLPNA